MMKPVSGQPGVYHITGRGTRTTFPTPATAGLSLGLVLDPPTARTGQCAELAFAPGACVLDGRRITCR